MYIAAISISNPILLFRFILYFFLPVLCACPTFTTIIMAEHLKSPERKITEALLSTAQMIFLSVYIMYTLINPPRNIISLAPRHLAS